MGAERVKDLVAAPEADMLGMLRVVAGLMVVGISAYSWMHAGLSNRTGEEPTEGAAPFGDEDEGPSCRRREVVATPWRAGSALVFDERRGVVYAADADLGLVQSFTADLHPLGQWPVGATPSQMVLNRDGSLVVAVRGAGDVVRLEPDGISSRQHLGGEPWGLARSDDGSTVFVTLATGDEVVALDALTLDLRWRTAVSRGPRAIAALPSGVIVVGHLQTDSLTTVDGADGQLGRSVQLATDAGRRATQVSVLAPIGDRLLAFHNAVNSGLETDAPPSDEYGGEQTQPGGQPQPIVSALSVFTAGLVPLGSPMCTRGPEGDAEVEEEASQAFFGSGFDDDVDNNAQVRFFSGRGGVPSFASFFGPSLSQPVAVVPLPALAMVVVASRGTDLVQFRRLHDSIPMQAVSIASMSTQSIEDGPSALAADAAGTTLYVLTAFSRQVKRFDLRNGLPSRDAVPTMVALGPSGLPAEVELGRKLFHAIDRRISGAGLACVSCHPDGREDGLVWSIAGARHQTPSLAGRLAGTAPYNWEGDQPTLEGNIAQTIQRLGGVPSAHQEDEVLKPLAAYLLTLQRPDNPHRTVAPERTQLVARGRTLFESTEVGCIGCHDPDHALTDGDTHDVGTIGPVEVLALKQFHDSKVQLSGRKQAFVLKALDTPSLRDLALTPPYLHDGSAPTLEAVLVATVGEMGDASRLSNDDQRALLAYLETL